VRIAFAKVWAEISTVSPVETTLDDFRALGLHSGEEILDRYRGVGELGGFMAAAAVQRKPVSLLPLVHANGWTGGIVTAEAMTYIEQSLLSSLAKAMPIHGFYFALHGAMVAEGVDDVSGHLLAYVREEIGPNVPLVASFDHHGNLTRKIVRMVDALVAYWHTPHTDTFDTGERAASLLFPLARGEIKTSVAWRKIPLVAPSYQFNTAHPPLRELFAEARKLEKHPGVAAVSVFPVFPHMDVPELGWSTAVVTYGDRELAQRLADDLAQKAWNIRQGMFPPTVGADEAVAKALRAREGPIILVDGADNVNGGAPGDSTHVLRSLLTHNPDRPALITVVDPEAVEVAIAAGLGHTVTLSVGGKRDHIHSRPVSVTGRVANIADGRFSISGHIGGAVNMGRTVLLDIGQIRLVLSERIGPGHDPVVYTHLGLDPRTAQIVVVKCTAGFWQAYGPFLKGHFLLDTPGLAPNDLTRLAWRKVGRPIYPLDDLHDWQPSAMG
jgi:microcystin degradation protein MlrC